MTICPCDDPEERGLENIPAGLESLPRQLRAFPEVRRALLTGIGGKTALENWNGRGARDLGVMLLEMWAYVGDVLGFYDERIANESYVRTAKRRPSLRRLVDLLGYVPAPGVAASTSVAAIAEGKRSVALAAAAGFRSNAFGSEAPQVFESGPAQVVQPLANQWQIGPAPRNRLGETLPTSPSPAKLIFRPEKFGLAKDRLVLIDFLNAPPAIGDPPGIVSVVTAIRNIKGEDGKTYVEVALDESTTLTIPSGTKAEDVRVRTPTVTARVTANTPTDMAQRQIENIAGNARTRVYLDARYPQLKESDPIVTLRSEGTSSSLRVGQATEILELTTKVIPTNDSILVNVTQVTFEPNVPLEFVNNPRQLSFHFSFVDAGQVTLIDKVNLTSSDLGNAQGVPIGGIVETPPNAVDGVLEQDFLIQDKDLKGALVHGRMTFDQGNATFQLLEDVSLLPFDTWKTPITVFGNVVDVTRGETVSNEVLGNGDPRSPSQQFKLKKKPLTYVPAPERLDGRKTTLSVRVNGILWKEVRSFFGTTPEDEVYTVRTNDAQETVITFGDGVHGARLPSGVKNVVASYRFGAGKAAPPANSITSLKGQVKGIRSVVGPIAALPGKDPDSPADLRKDAPASALLFGRLVSVQDYEVAANRFQGVTKAVAEWAWFPEALTSGVAVHVIADKETDTGLLTSKLIENLRAQGDPTVPISVDVARPLASAILLNLETDPRFEADKVVDAVRASLFDEETGILAPKNATIGGTFWISRLYDAVLAVPGVVSVESALILVEGMPPFGELDPNGGICVPSGAYINWANFVQFKAVDPVGPIPGERRTGASP